MYFVVKNNVQAFTPKILFILTNMAEAKAFTATYLSSISKHPYFYYLVDYNDLNNMVLFDIILRILE